MCEEEIDFDLGTEIRFVCGDRVLHQASRSGVRWTCRFFASTIQQPENLDWKFEWDERTFNRFDGFHVELIFNYVNKNRTFTPLTLSAHLRNSGESVRQELETLHDMQVFNGSNRCFKYSFKLTTAYFFDQNHFALSDLTDVVLVVGGKKLHVNRAHLAIHSKFFRSMFFSEFKEKAMEEVEIKDVSYEDLALLLSQIYPNPCDLTDFWSETLLKLADRFLMSGVISQIEHHLLEHSELNHNRLLLLADKYGLERLMKKTVAYYETKDRIEELTTAREYKELSSDTKVAIFERLLPLL